MTSRPSRRGDLPPDTRVRMLEEDMDRAEEKVIEAKTELDGKIAHAKSNATIALEAVKIDFKDQFAKLEKKVDKGFAECEERDERTRRLLTGLLVSIVMLCVATTAGVLVALGGA